MKKERKLKVYGYEGRNYSDPPEIRLKGKWLWDQDFHAGDKIRVLCEQGKLTIIRIQDS